MTQSLALFFSTVPSTVILIPKIHFEPNGLFYRKKSINFQYGFSRLHQSHYWHNLFKGWVYRRHKKWYKIIFKESKYLLTFTMPLNLFIKYIILFPFLGLLNPSLDYSSLILQSTVIGPILILLVIETWLLLDTPTVWNI